MPVFSDDFSGTTNATFAGRTATGANGGWAWTEVVAGLTIQNNAARNNSFNGAGHIRTPNLGASDMFGWLTLVSTASSATTRLRLRANATDLAAYQIRCNSGTINLESVDAPGTETNLGFRGFASAVFPLRVGLELVGNSVKAYTQRLSDSRWKMNTSAADHTGTAQAGGASTITLASGASSTNSFYNNCAVTITGGTGSGQVRNVSGYVGSTKVATVDVAWDTPPDATSTYRVEWYQVAQVACISVTNATIGSGTYAGIHNVSTSNNHMTIDDFEVTVAAPVNNAPTARFHVTSRDDLTVSVEDYGSSDPDGDTLAFDYDWGDDTAHGSTATASHTYASAGTYTVTLTVSDGQGGTSAHAQSVTVLADQDADVDLAPGATAPGSWTAISTPSAVGSGEGATSPVTGTWDMEGWYWLWSSDDYLYLCCDASNGYGVDRVEFFCNGGSAAKVVKPVKRLGGGGRLAFRVRRPVASYSSNLYCEFRAVAYPHVGQPTVFQTGAAKTSGGSFYQTANVSPTVKYINVDAASGGDGSDSTPWNDLGSFATWKSSNGTVPVRLLVRSSDGTIPWAISPNTNNTQTGGVRVEADTRYNSTITIRLDPTGAFAGQLMRPGNVRYWFYDNITWDFMPTVESKTSKVYNGLFEITGEMTCGLGLFPFAYVAAGLPLSGTETSITVDDASRLPATGTGYTIRSQNDISVDTVSWAGKTGNILTGVTWGIGGLEFEEAHIGDPWRDETYAAGYFMISRAYVHDMPFTSVDQLADCARDSLFENCTCERAISSRSILDCEFTKCRQMGHADGIQHSSYVDDVYIDGARIDLYIYGFTAQVGNNDKGLAGGVFKRILFEGDAVTAFNICNDTDSQPISHYFFDRCTFTDGYLRFFGAKNFENIYVRRCEAESFSVESAVVVNGPFRFDHCHAYGGGFTGQAGGLKRNCTTGGTLATLFTDPADSDYWSRDFHPLEAGPLDAGLTEGPWQEYDANGDTFAGEIGALAVTEANPAPGGGAGLLSSPLRF